MWRIGIFSKMNRITIKTLRHYDDIGIFKPAHVDDATGYRYYTSEQLPQLHQIVSLRQIGFSLDEIAAVQKGTSPARLLQHKKEMLLREISERTLMLSRVEHNLAFPHEESLPLSDVLLKELPPVTVASMRTVISSYDDLLNLHQPMGAEMERLGCVCLDPPYCFNVYHDGEYREKDIDVEICEAIVNRPNTSEMITFKDLPPVKEAACILHKGNYKTLPMAYGALMQWIDFNNYELDGNPRESYIDGIWNKSSEDHWLTEIQFPVKKRTSLKI